MTGLEANDPRAIGTYSVLRRIGAGATGVVYLATDSEGSLVAIKVIRPEIADAPNVRQRLLREAESLIKVEGQRTVKLIEINADAPAPYLVMQYIEGQDLSSQIANEGPLRGAMLRVVFLALVEALKDIHSATIVHRDLKPSNIIIGSDGIHVVDFGISAIQEEASLTGTGAVVGTAAWMSPEQVEGNKVGPESDIFNLGLVMAYVATGQHPFGSGRPDALMYRLVHSEPQLDGVPTQFQEIVRRCLAKDSSTRPSLAEIEKSISTVAGTGEPIGEGGTYVVASNDLQSQIDSDLNSSQRGSSASLEAVANTKSTQWLNFLKKRAVLGSIAALVLVSLSFGVNYAFSSEPTTTTTTTSTSTTIPIVPKFEIWRFKGKAIRWDSCKGPINIAVNFGSLSQADTDLAAATVIQVANEVSSATGLNFQYVGATQRTPKAVYRAGRTGSEAVLLAFKLGQKGLGAEAKNALGSTLRASYVNHSGEWNEFETVDGQFSDDLVMNESLVLLRVRQMMLRAVGLMWVESSHEILGYLGLDPSGLQAEYGPGDVQGMRTVGSAQGCMR